MISVQMENLEMFKLLIDNGAFPSINTPNYFTTPFNTFLIIKYVYKYIIVYCYMYASS
jgi:hypothetical protein